MRYGTETLMYYLTTLAQRSDLKGCDVFSEIRALCEDIDEGFANLQRQIDELKAPPLVTNDEPSILLSDGDGHDFKA